MMLEWKKGVRSETYISHRMTWRSKTWNYEVQKCTSKFEKTEEGEPMVYYYAIRSNRIIGRHRKKHRAYETCEKDCKQRYSNQVDVLEPKVKKVRRK